MDKVRGRVLNLLRQGQEGLLVSAPDLRLLLQPDFCPGHICLQTYLGNPHPYPSQPWV